MIWHDYKFMQFHMWKMFRDFQPTMLSNCSCFVQKHLFSSDFSKQMDTILTIKGNKVKSFSTVVIALHAYGLSVVNQWVVFHDGGGLYLEDTKKHPVYLYKGEKLFALI